MNTNTSFPNSSSIKNQKFWKIYFGIFQSIVTLALVLFFNHVVDMITFFVENKISSDGEISRRTAFDLKIVIVAFISASVIFNVLIYTPLKNLLRRFIDLFIDRKKSIQFFVDDKLCNKKELPADLFAYGTSFAFISFFVFMIIGAPIQEGYIEELSSLLFLLSGIILFSAAIVLYKTPHQFHNSKKIITILILFSIILLVVFGEEMSWGQRIFGWESTGVFKEYNYQRETNVHNFMNPIFKFAYPIVGTGVFFALFFAWLFPTKNKTYLLKLFTPHPSSFFLFALALGAGFEGHSEYFELLLEVAILSYSLRIKGCLRYPTPTCLQN